MFKLEFPANNRPLAAAIGRALLEYGTSDGAVLQTDGAHIHGTRPGTTAEEVVKSDGAAAVEEYNGAETVKLNDSAAGLSESQAELADETQVPETVEHAAEGVPTVDKNNVPPNWSYCAHAAKPFYASGKYAGQWKKGTKVDQADYDKWYLAAKADAVAAHQANQTEEAYDTNNAFAGNNTNESAPSKEAPEGIGGFIKWTSEMQTAGHITQADITEAYTLLGLAQKDISPIEPTAQANILSLHSVLSAKVPA